MTLLEKFVSDEIVSLKLASKSAVRPKAIKYLKVLRQWQIYNRKAKATKCREFRDKYNCGYCATRVIKYQKYCHNCGQRLKWEGTANE